jgi:beta-phosphoglucomutase
VSTRIKAILFDMDGVLIDAKDWHYEALNKALSLFGMNISKIDHLTTFDGLPTSKKLEMLTFDRNLPTQLHGFINEMKQRYTMQIVHRSCKPSFIHEYTLAFLKSKGYKISVCSNSIRQTIDLMMEKAELAPYLDLVVSNQDVKNPKPHPEIYEKAINIFGLLPSECLVVEDNKNGVKAASSAGAHILEVSHVDQTNLRNILARIDQIERGI